MLEGARALYEVHVFVDTYGAPPEAVGHTVLDLAANVKAAAVVVAANDGVADEEVPLPLPRQLPTLFGEPENASKI